MLVATAGTVSASASNRSMLTRVSRALPVTFVAARWRSVRFSPGDTSSVAAVTILPSVVSTTSVKCPLRLNSSGVALA